jgi:hypothetical protein
VEAPCNVNIEKGEPMKKLLYIGELYFEKSEVFEYFWKENYEWSDGRGA